MIYGVGNDIIEIKRIKTAVDRSPSFVRRIFTEKELSRFGSETNYKSMAGAFAAKEAVAKAFGTGFSLFTPTDIEILAYDNGRPYAVLHNKALELYVEKGVNSVCISISHCREYATAICIIER